LGDSAPPHHIALEEDQEREEEQAAHPSPTERFKRRRAEEPNLYEDPVAEFRRDVDHALRGIPTVAHYAAWFPAAIAEFFIAFWGEPKKKYHREQAVIWAKALVAAGGTETSVKEAFDWACSSHLVDGRGIPVFSYKDVRNAIVRRILEQRRLTARQHTDSRAADPPASPGQAEQLEPPASEAELAEVRRIVDGLFPSLQPGGLVYESRCAHEILRLRQRATPTTATAGSQAVPDCGRGGE
jgi:hypothetical protein